MIEPTNLELTPGREAITAKWGVNETEGLTGFKVRHRPVTSPVSPWSAAVQLSASARSWALTGIKPETTHEIEVKALAAGGTAESVGTPS